MESAVFAETVTDCQHHIDKSIKKCPYEELKRYIRTRWTIASSYNGEYSRMDSPLHQEISTIISYESYHPIIRKFRNQRMSLKRVYNSNLEALHKRYTRHKVKK